MPAALDWNLSNWTLLPFATLLLGIAVLPLIAPHWWERNSNKLKFALLCGLPAAFVVLQRADDLGVRFTLHEHPLLRAMHEYAAFLLLLLALFTISGGIHVKGTFAGTPLANTTLLAIGGVLASLVGTTGASMLLVRPLLRANAARRRTAHVFVFFIFVVANCGGLLTPLGDPPLFLGFLHGVPFGWTLGLWKPWLLVVGALLVAFQFVDSWYFHREDVEERRDDLDKALERARRRLSIDGAENLLLLAGVIGTIWGSGRYEWPLGAQEAALASLAGASLVVTPRRVRAANEFKWAPIVEVAFLFLGLFLAMVPALNILNERAAELGLSGPRSYFWATGALSSFLDNAPTYLAFASVACGARGIPLAGHGLAGLLDPARGGPDGAAILAAVSCGAVFMGAMTYIGNGPNFMVKAIAESAGVRMPSFVGYMAWSVAVLIPLFLLVTFLVF
jgi:Na+/H+ antiporter NhaD/arsenite permease-like protein